MAMKKGELSESVKVNVWMSFRSTLGVWEAVCLSLLTAGSALVASAYGIILINAEKLGDLVTFFLCFILLLACFCIEFIVFMFNNSVTVVIEASEKIEDSLFGKEESYLKITRNLSKSRNKLLPFLQFRIYTVWGGMILFSALIITSWRAWILFN